MLKAFLALPERYGRPAVSGAYLLPLDGLRALAIAIVIVWHVAIRVFRLTLAGPMVASDDAGFLHDLPHGEVGVSLFFFISGFIIARPFLSRDRRMSAGEVRRFYLRRLIRIAPPHLILIAAAFLALAVAGYRPARAVSFEAAGQSLWASLAASVLYLNGLLFHSPPRLNPPTWSLEIEMQFYLAFPLLLALYVRLWARAPAWAASILPPAAGLAISLWAYSHGGAYGPLRWTVLAYTHLFLLGISIARLEVSAAPRAERSAARDDGLFVLGLGLLLATGLFRDLQSEAAYAIRAVATMGAVLLLFHGATRGRIARRLLSNRWIALAGAMSYSIYLTHVAVIQLAATILFKIVDLHAAVANMTLALLVLTPPVLVVGGAYYIVVERFFMTIGHHARQPRVAVEAGK